MSELRLPDVTHFDELFCDHRPEFEVGKKHWDPIPVVSGAKAKVSNVIGEYCLVDNPHQSFHVRPTQQVIDSIRADCVVHDAGPLYFKIVRRGGGKALVVWNYNSILGGRWLAEIDENTIPKEG